MVNARTMRMGHW